MNERGDTPRGVREHVQHPKKQWVLASADSLGSEFIGVDEVADEGEKDKRAPAQVAKCSDEGNSKYDSEYGDKVRDADDGIKTCYGKRRRYTKSRYKRCHVVVSMLHLLLGVVLSKHILLDPLDLREPQARGNLVNKSSQNGIRILSKTLRQILYVPVEACVAGIY